MFAVDLCVQQSVIVCILFLTLKAQKMSKLIVYLFILVIVYTTDFHRNHYLP